MTTSEQSAFSELKNQQYILLKTFRKNGEAVATPVWFAQEGEQLYITTDGNAGKVKRIRNNGKVLLAPCDARGNVRGSEVAGQAREVSQSDHPHANKILAAKFGLLYQIFMLMGKLRRGTRTYLVVTPASAS